MSSYFDGRLDAQGGGLPRKNQIDGRVEKIRIDKGRSWSKNYAISCTFSVTQLLI